MDALKDRVDTRGELRQFISFSVGEEEYGLELLRVKEVIRVREITWLPKAPSFVKGIINLRGDVIPIIDLRDKFGLEAKEATAMTRVIVVEVEGKLMGMVVDSASQVVRIPADQIDPPPPVLRRARAGLHHRRGQNRRQADHSPEQRSHPHRGGKDATGLPARAVFMSPGVPDAPAAWGRTARDHSSAHRGVRQGRPRPGVAARRPVRFPPRGGSFRHGGGGCSCWVHRSELQRHAYGTFHATGHVSARIADSLAAVFRQGTRL